MEINNLDEAREAAFLQLEKDGQEVQEGVSDGVRGVESDSEMVGRAAETAAAVENESQFQQAIATAQEAAMMARQLQQENLRLQQAMAQMSQRQEQAIVQQVMPEEPIQPPVLDLSDLQFLSPEALTQRQAEYAQQMAKYAEHNIMSKIEPFVNDAQKARVENEKRTVIEQMAKTPEMADVNELLPAIENVLKVNPLMQGDAPLSAKLLSAYMIAKAANGLNSKPEEISSDKFVELYNSNTEFQDAIERVRSEKVVGKDVPPFSVGGASNAALNIPEKPKTIDQATALIKKLYLKG